MAGDGVRKRRAALVLLVGGALAAVVAARAAPALACGPDGYVYAGEAATAPAFGIRAVVTPVMAARVRSGHVAGWVGVGGPSAGPAGADEWLQVGLSAFPGEGGYDLYYEVTVAGGSAAYHRLATRLSVGRPVRVAVLELHGRPGWWRVWVGGAPRSEPIFLPGSDRRWAPMATTESWDGGEAGPCTNTLLFRFGDVRIADAPGGGWHALGRTATIGDPGRTVRRARGAFLAAAGAAAIRRLGSTAR